MRSLPVRVRMYRDESPVSYFSRLCAANRVTEHAVWRILREEDPLLGLNISPFAARDALCELAALPPRSFKENGHRYASTCGHDPTLWVRACSYCNGTSPGLMSLCRRCSQGELVLVERAVGPICVKHARWHANGLDVDVRSFVEAREAQKRLNGGLHASSIGYRSTIAAVARDAMNGWWHPARSSSEQVGLAQEISRLPQLIELVLSLSSRPLFDLFDDGSVSNRELAELLISLGKAALHGGSLEDVIQAAVEAADGKRSARPAGVVSDEASQAVRRMKTIRSQLLRHMNVRVDRWPSYRGESGASRPIPYSPPPYRTSIRLGR